MLKSLPVALLLLVAATQAGAQAVTHVGTFRFPVTVQGHTLNLAYDANQSVTSAHASVQRLVILVHGSARHSDTALESLTMDAKTAGVNDASSLLIGPQFLTAEDISARKLPSDVLFWEDDGWKQGDQSLTRPADISSFAVLDSMLYRVASLCPNLRTIVIGGHSAGGQFTNRYACGSRMPQVLAQQFGIQMSYVVANPSSYLYLDATRLVPGTTDTWTIPKPSCSAYNQYKYGMQSRNPYMAAVPDAQIASQYGQRRVTYLLGGADIDPNGDGVDTDCGAEVQGRFRLERGQTYMKFLRHFYGPAIAEMQDVVVVPGVAHDSKGMFTSKCGVARLFLTGACGAAPPPPTPPGPPTPPPGPPPPPPTKPGALAPAVTLKDGAISDQNDMCIWVNASDHARSTIITSDKNANRLFVYDLSGKTLQSISTSGQPGNVDVRYGFVLGGVPTDIVAFNDRTNKKIQVFKVDPATRMLSRVDNNAVTTGTSYGFTLYRSATSGVTYAFTTSKGGGIKQFRLSDQGGRVAGTQVRSWSVGGAAEGCAADDANATVFLSEESKGVWKVGAEPDASTSGTLIIRVGDASGLKADVEGIAIDHEAGSAGFLVVSSQGSNDFKVYGLQAPHAYVRTFTIDGVTAASGIEVTNANLGPAFPGGIFTAQDESPSKKTVVVCRLESTFLPTGTSTSAPPTNAVQAPASAVQATSGSVEDAPRPALMSYPNPFAMATQVRYTLPTAQRVDLDVLDVAGRVVATLASGVQDAGIHEVRWNASSARGQRLPNGLYLVRMRLGTETLTHKVIVSQ